MTNIQRGYRKIKRYFQRTYKAKLCAITLIGLGALTLTISNDGTYFVFTSMIGLPMFFAN